MDVQRHGWEVQYLRWLPVSPCREPRFASVVEAKQVLSDDVEAAVGHHFTVMLAMKLSKAVLASS